MKYLLTLYMDQSQAEGRTPEDRQAATSAGHLHAGGQGRRGLRGRRGPSVPRHRHHLDIQPSGDHTVTHGPFVETREQLGGFDPLDCADLDGALAWARKIPMPGGKVEVRPVMDYEAVGSSAHTSAGAAQ